MPVSKTPRLGLTRWSDDGDPWDREDFDDDNAQLEALGIKRLSGTALPAADAANAGAFFTDTDDGELYYSHDGASWVNVALNRAGINAQGTVGLGAGIVAVGTGPKVYRRAGIIDLLVHVKPTTNAPGGNTIVTVPAGFRPVTDWFATLVVLSPTQVQSIAAATMSTTGILNLAATVPADHIIVGSLSYPAAP